MIINAPEEMVKEEFEKIKKVDRPSMIRPDRFCGFCPLYKTYFDNAPQWPNGDLKDKCYQLKNEIYSIGMTATMKKHMGDSKHLYNYTEGGGRETK
jgi:hypothetical protein